jgi:hypothetical protein
MLTTAPQLKLPVFRSAPDYLPVVMRYPLIDLRFIQFSLVASEIHFVACLARSVGIYSNSNLSIEGL